MRSAIGPADQCHGPDAQPAAGLSLFSFGVPLEMFFFLFFGGG